MRLGYDLEVGWLGGVGGGMMIQGRLHSVVSAGSDLDGNGDGDSPIQRASDTQARLLHDVGVDLRRGYILVTE